MVPSVGAMGRAVAELWSFEWFLQTFPSFRAIPPTQQRLGLMLALLAIVRFSVPRLGALRPTVEELWTFEVYWQNFAVLHAFFRFVVYFRYFKGGLTW